MGRDSGSFSAASEDATSHAVLDERRPPFCYQTHAALDALRVAFPQARRRNTALALYLVLTEVANRSGGSGARGGFRASRARIAELVGVSPDTVDRYTADLVEAGLLAVARERVEGLHQPNVWTLLEPGSEGSRTREASSRTREARVAASERPIARASKTVELELRKKDPPSPLPSVAAAWRACSPPLIAHRQAYFEDEKLARKVKAVTKTYPAEAVCQAVRNYAAVLAGPEYRWDHSWTLLDFLARGLDRFVDEARPLENFRRRAESRPDRVDPGDMLRRAAEERRLELEEERG